MKSDKAESTNNNAIKNIVVGSRESGREKIVKMPTAPKVSNTFAESMPMFASFVNMYGKSFVNARKLQ